jgi:hypothetical protein
VEYTLLAQQRLELLEASTCVTKQNNYIFQISRVLIHMCFLCYLGLAQQRLQLLEASACVTKQNNDILKFYWF